MKLDRATLEKMYFSFIRPVMEYADVIWHIPADNRHMLDILERIQLEAARLVTGATRRCPTAALYKEVGWELLSTRRQQHRASMMYKIQSGRAPTYLQDLVPSPIQARQRYNLRNNANLEVPFARLESYSQSFFPASTRLWNSIPLSIREAPTVNSFKARYLKANPRPKSNKLFYYGKRFPSVMHARMRIGCSMLNYDLHFNLHVIENPNCRCSMAVHETAEHFFTVCPLYNASRIDLYAKLFNIPNLSPISIELLLYGDPSLPDQPNQSIFNLVHHFILQTNRFNS